MTHAFVYARNRASEQQLAEYLHACDAAFSPPLSTQLALNAYAQKINQQAERFEMWAGACFGGIVAAYCNDLQKKEAFITHVSVLPVFWRQGVAAQLLKNCIAHVKMLSFSQIKLEVLAQNSAAITLYEAHGFQIEMPLPEKSTLRMCKQLTDSFLHNASCLT